MKIIGHALHSICLPVTFYIIESLQNLHNSYEFVCMCYSIFIEPSNYKYTIIITQRYGKRKNCYKILCVNLHGFTSEFYEVFLTY